ncbi:hypothetical protein BCT46_23795 [Vibrio sp. 10N.261.46.E8]|nr:hypothetical protein BH584_23735 [Vibrio sp. 10N.261.45.E1]PMJ25786.1 hypothetical protein BCU27_10000 [Vibrio sp. 10N.286.45.B6]PML84419.1 hypothetical protein BCT66_17390 [Vibrio sp. 10N.261.49.E11]PMM90193.1 hypothetical protein BCT46_23795 [Vibrio sp. 10N.261.46.E8]PMN46156.1 hypothetical protein BCT32_11215 [Vibrio sp. 10N.261.45.E11]PMN79311.1 hypothetical protein BCT22_18005 [Vibrio sp. 10N.261.45.A1]
MFVGMEGISSKSIVLEGVMTYQEWAGGFTVEANSDSIEEKYKSQRDVDEKRVSGLDSYFDTRTDISLPGITIFVTELDIVEEFVIGNRKMVRAILHPNVGRAISDGQGRTENNRRLMEKSDKYANYTIAFKMIVTKTETIWEARHFIQQHFADFNGTSSKPNTSISLRFDRSKPVGRLLSDLTENTYIARADCYVVDLLGLQGKVKRLGKLWTYAQFVDCILTFFGVSKNDLNKALANEPEMEEMFFHKAQEFVQNLFNALPLEILFQEDWKSHHDGLLFNKAIFANAVGKVGKSIVDEHLMLTLDESQENNQIDWSRLTKIESLPIKTTDDVLWLKSKISYESKVRGVRVVKINKDSEVKSTLGRLVCSKLRISPCMELI